MAEVAENGKESSEDQLGLFCDICMEDNQKNQAASFCFNCKKYMCQSCDKYHGKFFLSHKTVNGNDMPSSKDVPTYSTCSLHKTQELVLFCEEHTCLLCTFCHEVNHNQCSVKDIHTYCKEINISKEIDKTIEKVEAVKERLIKKTAEQETEMESLSKWTEQRKAEISNLQMELVSLLDSYQEFLGKCEKTQMKRLEAIIATENSFVDKAVDHLLQLKGAKNQEKEYDMIEYLLSSEEYCKKYESIFEDLSTMHSDQMANNFYNDKIPNLVRKLSELNVVEEAGSDECHQAETDIVTTKHIKHCTRVKSVSLDTHPNDYISNFCVLPNEQVVLLSYTSDYDIVNLTLLNKDCSLKSCMAVKMRPFDIATVDDKSVVMTVPDKRIIQFVTVKPGLRLGYQFISSGNAYGVSIHDNRIYVCTHRDLNRNAPYYAVLVLNTAGTHLTTMSCPEELSPRYVCLSSDLSMMFFTSPYTNRHPLQCITNDGHIIYSYANSEVQSPKQLLSDEVGNTLVVGDSGIKVIDSKGKIKELLAIQKLKAMRFDKKTRMLFVLYNVTKYDESGKEYSEDVLSYFKITYG